MTGQLETRSPRLPAGRLVPGDSDGRVTKLATESNPR